MTETTVRTDADLLSALTRRVADAEGVEPTDLPPLAYTVDLDVLEAIIASDAPDSVAVSFEYCGYDVTVDADGSVHVQGGA